jgi:hypothetical protein
MTPMAHRRYLPPAEPPRQRLTRGDLVGFVGLALFIIGTLAWAAGQP